MKKLIAIVTTLCLMLSAAAFAEGNTGFTVREGITFGMTENELTAALGDTWFELDVERTRAATFNEVETEHVTVNGLRADVRYLFFNDRLAAVNVDFDEHVNAYDQVRTLLTGTYGEPSAVDPALLGNGVYAVDDDGRIEGRTECWVSDDVMIILERDRDGDADVHLIDLTAEYIH